MMFRRLETLVSDKPPTFALLAFVSRVFVVYGLVSVSVLPSHAADQTYYRYGLPQATSVQPPEEPLQVTVSPSTQSMFLGQTYAAHTTATGNKQPLTFSFVAIEGDPVAHGLSLDQGGSVTGILGASGRTVFRVLAIEAITGRSAQSNLVTIDSVTAALVYPAPTTVLEGDAFTTAPPSTNIPTPAFTFASSVPGWLTINPSSGAISGTSDDVTATVVVDALVRAANGPIAATANWSIQVQATSVVLNALPTAVIPGQSVSAQPTTNLSGPVTWSLIGTPGWLQINPVTGAISGTAVTGQPVIGAKVLAERGAIKAETPPFSISLTSPISIVYGKPTYYFSTGRANTTSNPVLTGGAGAKTFSLVSGTMPPGVQLDGATGEISGNPSSEANTSLTVRVADSTGSAQTTISIRAQTVVASSVCFSGTGTFVVPAFNSLTARIVGAGGGGGGLYPGTMFSYDGTAGGASTITLGSKTISVPGGIGGSTTTTATLGASLTTALPTVDWTGGTILESSRGQYGAQGLKTNSLPSSSAGSGGSSPMGASGQPTLPTFGSGSYSSPGTVAALGSGGSAGCYAPTSAQQGSYQGYQLWCGAGGSSGAYVSYQFNRSDPGSPNTGASIAYATGSRGTATTSSAGNGSNGAVCFSIE